jgi:hypothetical protein
VGPFSWDVARRDAREIAGRGRWREKAGGREVWIGVGCDAPQWARESDARNRAKSLPRQKNVTRTFVTAASHGFGHVHVTYRFF